MVFNSGFEGEQCWFNYYINIFFSFSFFFFFNDTATTEIYTLSLHDALPIYMKVGTAISEFIERYVRYIGGGTVWFTKSFIWPYFIDYRTPNVFFFLFQIGRAHVWTPVTDVSRMPSSAWKKKKKKIKKKKKKNTIRHCQTAEKSAEESNE